MPLEPLTREVWESFSDKAKWDIKVALRGPDSNYGEVLKWYTTSVIRGKMRDVFRVGGLINQDLDLVIVPRGVSVVIEKQFAGRTSWNYGHFIQHIKEAARWLNIPILSIEDVVWHDAMRERDTKVAGKQILEAASKFEKPEESLYDSKLYGAKALKELDRHLKAGYSANYY